MTGAAGFVGKHLTAHLAACGDDVVGTDRSEGGPDLLNPTGLARLVAEVDPEVVFHLAGHCLLYTSPSPRDKRQSRMPSSA